MADWWANLFTEQGQSVVYSFSVPFFIVIILAEMIYSQVNKLKLYSLRELVSNIYLALFQFFLDLLMRGIAMAVMFFFYQYKIIDWHEGVIYWILVLLTQDLAYYTLHLVDHKSRMLWAVHVTHHNSEDFNLTTGFRSSVFEPLYRFLFFSPLAFLGFNPWHIMVMYAIVQIYGSLVHTQSIKNMGFLEHILVTPSHHRVHHATNIQYLDKNYGMMFIIWDKMFGTFAKEDPNVKIHYGIYPRPEKKDPVSVVFGEWRKLVKDLRQPGLTWLDRAKYLILPPGWRHDGKGKTVKQYQQEYWEKKEKKNT